MSPAALFIAFYVLLGVLISECANYGHKIRYNRPIHWGMWVTGVFIWPVILMVGGRK